MNKLLSQLVQGIGLAALFLTSTVLQADNNIPAKRIAAWTSGYYLEPSPQEVGAVIQTLYKEGLFEKDSVQSTYSGFFAPIFRDNPELIESWIKPYSGTGAIKILYSALWMSGTPASRELMQELTETTTSSLDARLLRAYRQKPAPKLQDMQFSNPSSIDFLWGWFLGSGQALPVQLVIEQIKHTDSQENYALRMTGKAARWSLRSNARQHRKVIQIMQDRLDKVEPAIRRQLLMILKENGVEAAGADHPASSSVRHSGTAGMLQSHHAA